MNWTAEDRRFLEEAFAVAEAGRGATSPNPVVGALLVKDGRVVGRGYHARCGAPHAERMALDEAGDESRGATLYVTLEPCSVHGRTPPCTDAIIDAGIVRVVAPCRDPNPHVDGGGFELLRLAGIEIDCGLLEERAERENAPYLTFQRKGRPYVRLKLACSLDGRIAGPESGARRISSPESQEEVHALRSRVDGVLVGVGTALADDPMLTDRRAVAGGRQPRRYVLDTEARLRPSCALVRTAGEIETYVVCAEDAEPHLAAALEERGVRIIQTPRGPGGVDLTEALRRIAGTSTLDLLCEGGAGVATSLLSAGLVDRVMLYIAPRVLGESGTPAFSALPEGALMDGSAFQNATWTTSGRDMRFEADVRLDAPGEAGADQGNREATGCSRD